MRRAIAFVLAGVLLAGGTPVSAQLYSWTDASGITHYTADPSAIPPRYRQDVSEETLRAPWVPPAPRAADATSNGAGTGTVVEFTPGDPIVVNARLNGVPVALLLDTGADRTLLSPAAVARAGYGNLITSSDSSIRILGVTGSATAAFVTIPLLDVAGARLGPLSLIVHDAGLTPLDGLLGRDILDAFTVTIDSAAGRATLTPK